MEVIHKKIIIIKIILLISSSCPHGFIFCKIPSLTFKKFLIKNTNSLTRIFILYLECILS